MYYKKIPEQMYLTLIWQTECKSEGSAKILSFFNLFFHSEVNSEVIADLICSPRAITTAEMFVAGSCRLWLELYLNVLFKSPVVPPFSCPELVTAAQPHSRLSEP